MNNRSAGTIVQETGISPDAAPVQWGFAHPLAFRFLALDVGLVVVLLRIPRFVRAMGAGRGPDMVAQKVMLIRTTY